MEIFGPGSRYNHLEQLPLLSSDSSSALCLRVQQVARKPGPTSMQIVNSWSLCWIGNLSSFVDYDRPGDYVCRAIHPLLIRGVHIRTAHPRSVPGYLWFARCPGCIRSDDVPRRASHHLAMPHEMVEKSEAYGVYRVRLRYSGKSSRR